MSSPLLPLWFVEAKIKIALWTKTHGEKEHLIGGRARDMYRYSHVQKCICANACTLKPWENSTPPFSLPSLYFFWSSKCHNFPLCLALQFLCVCPPLLLIGTTILSSTSFPCLTGIESSMKNRGSHEEEEKSDSQVRVKVSFEGEIKTKTKTSNRV